MTEVHPVLERVAKAIHEHLCRRNIMQYLDNDEDCEGIARAAVMAMREVTEDMVEAGKGAPCMTLTDDGAIFDPSPVFTAMINTIIGEEK